jgi:hypothetical protein
MAISLNPQQVISFEEPLVSQVGQREALNWLVGEKGEIRLFLAIEECRYGFLDKAYKN